MKSSATRRTNQEEKLARLEEKCRHELLSEEERAELRDQVLRLRRRLGEAREER